MFIDGDAWLERDFCCCTVIMIIKSLKIDENIPGCSSISVKHAEQQNLSVGERIMFSIGKYCF